MIFFSIFFFSFFPAREERDVKERKKKGKEKASGAQTRVYFSLFASQ